MALLGPGWYDSSGLQLDSRVRRIHSRVCTCVVVLLKWHWNKIYKVDEMQVEKSILLQDSRSQIDSSYVYLLLLCAVQCRAVRQPKGSKPIGRVVGDKHTPFRLLYPTFVFNFLLSSFLSNMLHDVGLIQHCLANGRTYLHRQSLCAGRTEDADLSRLSRLCRCRCECNRYSFVCLLVVPSFC